MIEIALYQPEIAPNTGNIIRLSANTGAKLHLIHPLGFNPTDKQLRRAGLDYHDWTDIDHHDNYESFIQNNQNKTIWPISTKGHCFYHQAKFKSGDILLFGPETRGLPQDIRNSFPQEQVIKIPMIPNNRSLNLANAVSVVTYEAWRQLQFLGAEGLGRTKP